MFLRFHQNLRLDVLMRLFLYKKKSVVEVGVELGNDILSYADISAYIFPNQISAYYVIVIVAKPNLLLVASSDLRKYY